MLLPTMTYKQMYDHLGEDLKKVKIREDYYLPKAIKELKKERRFPACKWYEYTVPESKNKYIIFYYAEHWKVIDHPKVGSFCIVYDDKNNRYVIKWGARLYKQTKDSKLDIIREIQVYTPHFFSRYKERGLKDTSIGINEVVGIYLSRNRECVPITMTKEINRCLEKYGPGAKYGYRVRDGFCFASSNVQVSRNVDSDISKDKHEALYVVYKTFMNESDMKDNQLIAIDQEHTDVWQQTIEDFYNESEDGKLKFVLEK